MRKTFKVRFKDSLLHDYLKAGGYGHLIKETLEINLEEYGCELETLKIQHPELSRKERSARAIYRCATKRLLDPKLRDDSKAPKRPFKRWKTALDILYKLIVAGSLLFLAADAAHGAEPFQPQERRGSRALGLQVQDETTPVKTQFGGLYTIDCTGAGIVCSVSGNKVLITVAGGGGAPTGAQYLVLTLDGGLSAERRFVAGVGIGATDGGADGDYTLSLDLSELIANQVFFNGANATRTITFSLSGATDPILTLADGVFNVSTGEIQEGGVAVTKTISSTTGNCAQFDANGDLVDSGAGCGGGSGDNITVNATGAVDANFSDTDPAAPANSILVNWAINTAATPDNISASVLMDEITRTGTITSGTWQGTAIASQFGGTGQNFSASTGVLRAAAGVFSTDAGVSHLASSTSADLLGVLSDETGAGIAVFGTNPTLTDVTVNDLLTFTESIGDSTCAAGDYDIKGNSSTGKLRGCENGTLFDLNTAGGSTHDLLSATHTDTTAAAVSRGSLVVGQTATPVWQELVIGGANTFLTSDGTDATWGAATLASAQFANQGTTTTVLHGNAAGNPSWSAVVSADMNITTTSCTNQFVTAISSGGVGTCTTDTLASAQHANQGTTTTVLHGNAAGNPTWAAVNLANDVTGQLGDTSIAAGAVDGGAGGEIADGTVDSNDLATANKTFVQPIVLFDPTGLADTDDVSSVWRASTAITITEVWCEVDTGTTTSINLQRDDGTPANILSANLTCSTGGATGTIDAAEDNVAANERIDFVMVAAGTANRVSVMIKYTVD